MQPNGFWYACLLRCSQLYSLALCCYCLVTVIIMVIIVVITVYYCYYCYYYFTSLSFFDLIVVSILLWEWAVRVRTTGDVWASFCKEAYVVWRGLCATRSLHQRLVAFFFVQLGGCVRMWLCHMVNRGPLYFSCPPSLPHSLPLFFSPVFCVPLSLHVSSFPPAQAPMLFAS